jgi:hypothetical protein
MAVGIVPIFLKNAVAAYSLRRLTPKYTGFAIRIRRSNDNSETDIGFTSNGELDTTAISNFVTGGIDAFVTTWYDQSNIGLDQFRSNISWQPQIVSGGTLIMDNGKPALFFNGNSTMRSAKSTNLTSTLGEWSTFGVARNLGFDPGSAIGSRVLISFQGPNPNGVPIGQFLRYGPPNQVSAVSFNFPFPSGTITDGITPSGTTVISNQNILNSIRRTTSLEVFVNGQSNGPTLASGINNIAITPLDVGYRDGLDPFCGPSRCLPFGYIQELIHYNVDVSCHYDKILKIINSYYKVY